MADRAIGKQWDRHDVVFRSSVIRKKERVTHAKESDSLGLEVEDGEILQTQQRQVFLLCAWILREAEEEK